ncbi:hypothetical protein [Plantactinospora sp. KLBMP9567]|uniref:hypothetical protein n=1 Tax=Plantactinospora sp. KLBMP9567 TaxID=3085900 RepID=UPI002981B6CE|nr:hypothetical protein [Plantactinospora sp. KLBMP9567]MDW5323002.1 hypothetical protein [Plantactinospora sp. KLBMP9567]
MRASVGRECRVLVHSPVLWCGPVLLVAAAVLLMPVNAGYHDFWVNYDPQGDDQLLARYHTDGVQTATSGFLVGHLLALLLGAALVLADYAPARLAGPVPDPRRVLPGKLTVAVGAGLLLALLNAAVSIPLAASGLGTPPSRARVEAAGLSFDPDLLADSGVRLTIAVGLAMFPLLAAVGVGLGALVGTWSRLFAVLVLWGLASIVVGGAVSLSAPRPPALVFGLLLAALPISGHVAIGWGALAGSPVGSGEVPTGYPELAAVAALAGGLGYASFGYRLGAALLRRRLAERQLTRPGH